MNLRPPTQRRSMPSQGFTLIELSISIAIVLILASLVLATAGYVQKRGLTARAEAEVAALSAAIESYKTDWGEYPPVNSLYSALSSDKGKAYFEFQPRMVRTNTTPRQIIDPWGEPYVYQTNAGIVNTGFFDLYSRGGAGNNTNRWIRN